MGQELEKVKSGYAKLDSYDQARVKEFIKEFDSKPDFEKKAIDKTFSESVRNKSLGPVSSASCPCCGR